MSKEFKIFQQAFDQKQSELEIQARENQKVQEEQNARKLAEARQKQIESEQRATENRTILENLGIVRLFEEIRDSGLVKYRYDPTYKTEWQKMNHYKDTFWGKKFIGNWAVQTQVKVSDFEPAKIVWGNENNSISLQFNEDIVNQGDNKYPNYCSYWEEIIFYNTPEDGYILCDFKNSRENRWQYPPKPERIKTKIKTSEIPEYVAIKISEALNKK